jgi:hypothetical protein
MLDAPGISELRRINDIIFRLSTGTTKTFLHRLVIAVFKGILPSICPAGSARISKRSKARMIAWLDRNAGELFHFLILNSFFNEA